MFELRLYLIALCGTFLALGLGLLMGISFGEDVVIHNQQEVISQLEKELEVTYHANQKKTQKLKEWQEFQSYFWKNIYADLFSSEEKKVGIITYSTYPYKKMQKLLEDLKVNYWILTIKPNVEDALQELATNEFNLEGENSNKNWFKKTWEEMPYNFKEKNETETIKHFIALLKEYEVIQIYGDYNPEDTVFLMLNAEEVKMANWILQKGEFFLEKNKEVVVVWDGEEAKTKEEVVEEIKEEDKVTIEPSQWDGVIEETDSFWIKLNILEKVRN